MAIRITEDGVVIYENEPDVERELFPNIPLSGGTPEQITQAVNTWLEEHPEATTTVEDGSITKTKLDSNLQTELDSMDSEIGELKENLSDLKELADTKAAAIYETASGEIASFSDGADDLPLKSCVVKMEPVQDLHGYGHPWPAGGGVNVLDPNLKFTAGTYFGGAVVSTQDGYNITLSGTPTESGDISTNRIATSDAVIMPAGTYTSSGGTFSTYKPDGSWYANRQTGTWTADSDFIVRNIYIQAVANSPVSGSRFICLVKGSTVPTEWTPYENICPISGRTGLSVVRTGKNLYGRNTGKYNEPVYTTDGSSLPCEDVNVVWIKVKPNTTYLSYLYLNGEKSAYMRWIECDKDKRFIWRDPVQNTKGNPNRTRTTKSNTEWIQVAANQFAVGELYKNVWEAVISEDLSITDYEPYKGSTYSVNWETEAGTVYGGSLDVVSGKLTVDSAYIASYNGETLPSTWISDRDVYTEGATPTTGAQVVYELATPTEIQLAPQEIRTLLGVNSIWSDAGSVAVEYPADTKMYIDTKIAEAVAAAMA